jgi:hypothetical protein
MRVALVTSLVLLVAVQVAPAEPRLHLASTNGVSV